MELTRNINLKTNSASVVAAEKWTLGCHTRGKVYYQTLYEIKSPVVAFLKVHVSGKSRFSAISQRFVKSAHEVMQRFPRETQRFQPLSRHRAPGEPATRLPGRKCHGGASHPWENSLGAVCTVGRHAERHLRQETSQPKTYLNRVDFSSHWPRKYKAADTADMEDFTWLKISLLIHIHLLVTPSLSSLLPSMFFFSLKFQY